MASPPVPDAALIARVVVNDDRHAFAELVRRHQSTVRACLRKLTAGCYADNKGSRIAFERAGFAVEAVRRAHFVSDGRLEDLVLLARFADH